MPLPVALPFDPNPRPPGWTLPANACDTHFHVFGPPNIFPYAAARRYEPPAAPVEYYWEMQKVTGLSRAIAVQPTAHGVDNSALLDAIARSDGHIKGVANIDDTMSMGVLEDFAARGIVGARFSLMSDRPGTRTSIEKALPRLQKLGWSLVLHVEPEHFLASESFIRSIPVTTVIDHMARVHITEGLAQPAFQLLLDLLSDEKFWVKICCVDKISATPVANVPDGIPFKDIIPFAKAVIQHAPSRVIWGSDWPHGNTFTVGRVPNEGALLDLFAAFATDDVTRRRVLVDNPAKLYGFD